MTVYPIQPLTLSNVRTYPLASRQNKVNVSDFAKPPAANLSFTKFLDSLPAILAGNDLRDVAAAIHLAKRGGKAILWGLGGHVIKVGLGPVINELMRRGFISGIAMNGAALVHDFEVALSGGTSEDVSASLKTGEFLAGRKLAPGNAAASVLLNAFNRRVPVTVHLAIGTDIPHMHPMADGAALGAATHHDFRLFCAMVAQMDGGGAYL